MSPASQPSSFNLLHEKVRRWIWERGWHELRDLQNAAIRPILAGSQDVILSAATASGKTEAAFLPICTRLVDSEGAGAKALYISPLKALINDQFRRAADLCDQLDIPVHRWHGDVSADRKRGFIREPNGVLLITPESLEAMFIGHGPKMRRLFASLHYVVVDELHAFLDSERGRQLQSLLCRLETVLGRRVPRIALSATLGDMQLAADFLRPGKAADVLLLSSADGGGELKLLIRGYRTSPPSGEEDGDSGAPLGDVHAIADHLWKTLRGTDNLVFADRRADVELYADLLVRRSEHERVPNEFFAHHGSLSREIREDVESRLKKDVPGPVTVVCTSTLEMGIDIGSVKSVAQVGTPGSVAGLRQRVGRSGRRAGEPAVLRVYVREEEIEPDTSPEDQIRAQLVQSIAVVSLLLQGYCEPPGRSALHLSTLIQQLLSLIAGRGGVQAGDAFRWLCEGGAFSDVSKLSFVQLLRALGTKDILMQDADGTLLLGLSGERLVSHYSFFAAFHTPEEYRLVASGRTLGSLPISEPLIEGTFLIFSGRRWRIIGVDDEQRVVDLVPGRGGRLPRFGAGGRIVHERVRQEMRAVFESLDIPPYLDAVARDLLVEGRSNFDRLGLRERCLLPNGRDTLFFPWTGDLAMNTLLVQMTRLGFGMATSGSALIFQDATPDEVSHSLRDLLSRGLDDSLALAASVRNKRIEKHDHLLPEDLLAASYASRMLDCEGAKRALQRALENDD